MSDESDRVNTDSPWRVVIYHGSLAEYNGFLLERGSGSRAVVPEDAVEFVSQRYITPMNIVGALNIRHEILGKGYHGIVNGRRIYSGDDSVGDARFRVEGTPFVLESIQKVESGLDAPFEIDLPRNED